MKKYPFIAMFMAVLTAPLMAQYYEYDPCGCDDPFWGPYIGVEVGYGSMQYAFKETLNWTGSSSIICGDLAQQSALIGIRGGWAERFCACGYAAVDLQLFLTSGEMTRTMDGAITDLITSYDTVTPRWSGSLQGHFGGLLHDGLLLYAIGGLSFGQTSILQSYQLLGESTVTRSDHLTLWGATLGLGAAAALTDRWQLRFELTQTFYGKKTVPSVNNELGDRFNLYPRTYFATLSLLYSF